MTKREIKELLRLHKLWLDNKPEGKRLEIHDASLAGAALNGATLRDADLHGADLRGTDIHKADLRDADLGRAILHNADLSHADLSNADLTYAVLCEADLRGANLHSAYLSYAELREADLHDACLAYSVMIGASLIDADLIDADLSHANLRHATLNDAELMGADLTDVKVSANTAGFIMACPSEGPYIAWKKCDGFIVKLLIPEKAMRSSATTQKCRASEAKVLEIQTVLGAKTKLNSVHSDYDRSFVYTVGKTVKVKDFDKDRWNACSTGIHHFMDRGLAVRY